MREGMREREREKKRERERERENRAGVEPEIYRRPDSNVKSKVD